MPDITMCCNNNCPMRQECYRFTAEPNGRRQSWARFDSTESGNCDGYWPLVQTWPTVKGPRSDHE